MGDGFKFDAAFSFLQRDEQAAAQIADRAKDRLNVFVYTERQKELAGEDGMYGHSRIYGEEARVVVVLRRDGWGHTNWTRVEETAIKNRAFTKGFNFLVLVALDSSEKPIWLPKIMIWVDFSRYGINGVAASVEAAVQAEGGAVRTESAAEHAVRLERKVASRARYEKWRVSEEGVTDASKELDALYSKLAELAGEVSSVTRFLGINCYSDSPSSCVLACQDCNLTFKWTRRMRSSLSESGLAVRLVKKPLFSDFTDFVDPFNKTLEVTSASYAAEIDHNEAVGWRESAGEGRFLTSTQLAEFWVKRLLEAASSNEDDPQKRASQVS